MRINRFKEKLTAFQPCSIALASWHDPVIEEMCGLAGIDAFLLDCEHGCIGDKEIAEYVRACESSQIVPLLKLSEVNAARIQGYLDCGVMGLCIADVRCKEQAEQAVRAMKYAPLGERGISTVRATGYGLRGSQSEEIEAANKNTVLILMVENKEAVDHLDEILSVPGVDSVTVGTSDLSADLGHPGDRDHPEVLEAVKKVLLCARKHHIPVGTALRGNTSAREEYQNGFNSITCAIPGILVQGLRRFAEQMKECEGE